MSTLLETPVQPARRHALPFRVFFEEWRLRRRDTLLLHARAILPDTTGVSDDDVLERLRAAILTQEMCYAALESAKQVDNVASYSGSEAALLLAACDAADMPLKQILHRMNGSALCLSGGGIRSASFGLGVLEGLANFCRSVPIGSGSMLDDLDYLSTVSGGGYIGSWLSSWLLRRHQDDDAQLDLQRIDAAAAAPPTWQPAWRDVITALANRAPGKGEPNSIPVTGGDPEPQPVRHLRSYTSYLAPSAGASLDSFSLIAIVLRNLLINWVLLIPILFAAIAAVRLSGELLIAARSQAGSSGEWPVYGSAVCVLLAAICASSALPSHLHVPRLKIWRVRILVFFVSTMLVGCWLMGVGAGHAGSMLDMLTVHSKVAFLGYATLAFSIWLADTARIDDLQERSEKISREQQMKATSPKLLFWRKRGVVLLMAMLSAALCSVLASGLVLLVQRKLFPALEMIVLPPDLCGTASVCNPLWIVFGLPAILGAVIISTTLFCALLGIYEREEDREWWVRAGACYLAFGLVWAAAHAAVFYGSSAVSAAIKGVIGIAGVGLAGALSALGFSSVVPAGESATRVSELPAIGRFLMRHHLVLPGLALLAILMIALGNVALEESLRHLLPYGFWHVGVGGAAFFLAVYTAIAVLLNFSINVNLFSLSGMYRMRLTRAFLGASNGKRQADPFTNFDPKDSPLMTELANGPGAPLHVVNATLNLVGTSKTEWQQRRAESFTFSSVHSGGWRVGYVPTSDYGGPGGLTLASAMAMSGAAFNPNMGYQSSPVLALLMTFFCVRLGVWLPNPARPTPKFPFTFGRTYENFFSKNGPSFAMFPLLAEAFGLTDDTSRWVEITDGGHFENLGLYEMVMRRCKRIIVVDAGADPNCEFEDLGNAIRKIRIDLGVSINLKQDLKMHAGMQPHNSYCVVGDIDYGCVDTAFPGDDPATLKGTLIYIKAAVNGREPADVLQYAYTHTAFPHENTVNQFYSEAQFESYRHLGSWVIQSIVNSSASNTGVTMESFRKAAEQLWQNASS